VIEPSAITKRCWKCSSEKPMDEFYRNQSRVDGRQTTCKSCHLEVNRQFSRRHPETRRASLKRQYAREVERDGRRPSKSVPEFKKRAHRRVYDAIKRGHIIKPSNCAACGAADSPIHGHHEDYTKPLEVMWLCARCHGALHAGILVPSVPLSDGDLPLFSDVREVA
jgi:hypothetical protein